VYEALSLLKLSGYMDGADQARAAAGVAHLNLCQTKPVPCETKPVPNAADQERAAAGAAHLHLPRRETKPLPN
jgi:hypothetical protein